MDRQGKKIFIQRDYSLGTGVRFSPEFPRELQGRVDEAVYRATLEHINDIFDRAEALNCRAYCEGCMACLTGYMFQYCIKTHYERRVQEATDFIREENRTKYERLGVVIGDPMDRGLRCIEVFIMPEVELQT